MSSAFDAIVIGAGFAGVTAARELVKAGQRTLLVEGRDRLGGRTWTSELAGEKVELGGTWVHWFQPHVWAEIRRYGLELVESPQAERCGWITGGGLRQGSPDELRSKINDAVRLFCHDARELLERPHDPLFKNLSAIDALSVQDRLDELALDAETRDVSEGMWSSCCSAHCSETGLVQPLRWYALSGWDPDLMWDCTVRYKLRDGTRSLIEAIAADGKPEIRFSAPVEAVEQDAGGVAVRTASGETLSAKGVVVAVPLNTLGAIEFTPPLSTGKQAAAREGQSSHGVKVWVRARGDPSYFAFAPSAYGLTFLQAEYTAAGDTLFVGFGPDAAVLDVTDREAVAHAVQKLAPGAEVVGTHAHDWYGDEFARGTWSMYRPHQLTRYLRELQRPEERVFLAGSDVASGWNGFIDGAIESGLAVAGKLIELLR